MNPDDLAAMREDAAQLLAEDAEPPTSEALGTLTQKLRGNLMLLIPEVERSACGRPKDDVPKGAATAGITEARIRLMHDRPRPTLPSRIAHAQRLARSVIALLRHLEILGPPAPAVLCQECQQPIHGDAVLVDEEGGISGAPYERWAHPEHVDQAPRDLRPQIRLAELAERRGGLPGGCASPP